MRSVQFSPSVYLKDKGKYLLALLIRFYLLHFSTQLEFVSSISLMAGRRQRLRAVLNVWNYLVKKSYQYYYPCIISQKLQKYVTKDYLQSGFFFPSKFLQN